MLKHHAELGNRNLKKASQQAKSMIPAQT